MSTLFVLDKHKEGQKSWKRKDLEIGDSFYKKTNKQTKKPWGLSNRENVADDEP